MASSAYSSGVGQPRHSKRRTRLRRMSRYRSAAVPRSGPSAVSNPSNACWVKDHFDRRVSPAGSPTTLPAPGHSLRRLKIIGAPARTLQKSSVKKGLILNSEFPILIREGQATQVLGFYRIGIGNWTLIRFPDFFL